MRYLTSLLFACAAAAAAACGDSFGLQAYRSNVVDTVSLYALSGTPVTKPSGYALLNGAVRTEQVAYFDFAFDIDTAGRAVLLPTGALKLGQQSGLQLSTQAFDSLRIAPTANYHLDSAVVVHDSSVVLAHSAQVPCGNGFLTYYYAKLHVLTIDTTSTPNGRRIDFAILADLNCGFRGLEPGVPKQ
ncbi:MAG: hypothetical protein AUH41_04815 [Gemmatimonadetes bacterium 13_1_40CM_66_11]|nr:MAG: hypothetical protein AUH41_04815 [Gemmatimonadetes bacterium 13_1_40CM_66_11]